MARAVLRHFLDGEESALMVQNHSIAGEAAFIAAAIPAWTSLAPLHRALLVTDGTVTELLEAIFLERIDIRLLGQELQSARDSHPALECAPSERVLHRRVVLHGSATGRAYVNATSQICIDRLPPRMLDGLQDGEVPLGRLMDTFELETFKRLLDVRTSADGTGQLQSADTGLTRTYLVISGGRSLMLIQEEFPGTLRLPDG